MVLDGASYFQTNPRETATDKGNIDSLHISEFNATGGLKIVDGLFIRSMVISTGDPFVVELSSGWTTQFSNGDLVKVVFNNNGSVLSASSIYLEDPEGLSTGNPKNIDAYTEKQLVASGPIAVDLDHSGVVDYLSSSESGIVWDFGAGLSTSGWIAPADGLLIYDYNSDGLVLEAREFVLTRWGGDPVVSTDLQALIAYFDTNKDFVFDASDDAWASFKIWQDVNSSGVSELGEIKSLADYGIVGFDLSYNADSETSTVANGDVYIYGQLSVMYADGSVGLADDMEFVTASAADGLGQADAADSMAGLSSILSGGLADQVELNVLVEQFIDVYQLSTEEISAYQHEVNDVLDPALADSSFNDATSASDTESVSTLEPADLPALDSFEDGLEQAAALVDDSPYAV